jgi:hypothetical protein
MLRMVVTPEEIIPLVGMLTGIISMLVIGFTIVRVAQSQVGQAIARRIHGRGGADPELQAELLELREQVADLSHRLAENEERVDFTERLLAQGKEETKAHG